MRVVSADLWEPAPGQVFTWDVLPGAGPAPVPASLTYNQRNHLLGAATGEPSVWITAAFDVDGPVATDALEGAFRDLVARHASLRVEAVRRRGGPDLVRHAPDGLVWLRQDGPVTRTVEATREHLVAELGRRCAPFGYPAFLPAAISRPDRSTIVLGMDHLHTDAWSTTVVVDELAAFYDARSRRGAAEPAVALAGTVTAGVATVAAPTRAPRTALAPAVLARAAVVRATEAPALVAPVTEAPSTGAPSTGDWSIGAPAAVAPAALARAVVTPAVTGPRGLAPTAPASDNAPRPTTAAVPDLPADEQVEPPTGPARVGADDPRLAAWHGFLRDRGWALPTFPLPLGVPGGVRVPQRTVVLPLADAATADAVAARARSAGASTSAAVLATLAGAVADLGGPAVLETLLPVHTRGDAAARRAIGWHTTTVPLRIEANAVGAADVGGVTDTALATTGKALRAARELSAVPLEQVVESLPSPLRFPRVDIFQVSYLDYRRLPGHAAAAGRRAHHISAATRADDLQLWVSRTDDGVAVRARMPRTLVAVETIDRLLNRWTERLMGLTTG